MSEVDRVPSPDRLRELREALRKFFGCRDRCIEWFENQEIMFLELFANLADALRPFRDPAEADRSCAVEVAIPLAIEHFAAVAEEWGWQMFAEPEPDRTIHVEERRRRFQKEREQPYFEAVRSLWEARKSLGFDERFLADAREARARGCEPTFTDLEAARNVAMAHRAGRCWMLILGDVFPEIAEMHRDGLKRAYELIGEALDSIGPAPKIQAGPVGPRPTTTQSGEGSSSKPAIDKERCPVELRRDGDDIIPFVMGVEQTSISKSQRKVIEILIGAYPRKVKGSRIEKLGGNSAGTRLRELCDKPDAMWKIVIRFPDKDQGGYGLAWPVGSLEVR